MCPLLQRLLLCDSASVPALGPDVCQQLSPHRQGRVDPLLSFLHLHIPDLPCPTGPLPEVGRPTLGVRLGSLGALSSSSELPCSSSDETSSLGAAAEMGQTL